MTRIRSFFFGPGAEGGRPAPPSLAPPGAALRDALRRDLHIRSRMASPFALPVLFLLYGFLSDVLARNNAAAVWFAVLVLLASVRAALLWRFDPDGPAARARIRRWIVVAGAALFGAPFGAFTVAAAPSLSAIQFAMLAICASGFSAVALTSLIANRGVFFAYQVPMLGTVAACAALYPHPGLGGRFAALVVVFMLALTFMARVAHASLSTRIGLEIRFRELARRDGLTQLYNRSYVAEYVEAWAARAPGAGQRTRTGSPPKALGVIVVDIDHFKAVNDRYGHDSGDAVIQSFATHVTRSTRSTDIVARWGGEEFVILAPDADQESLRTLAERICRRIESRPFPLPSGEKIRVTCSAGYTALPQGAGENTRVSWEHLFAVADRALYHAKATGRNRAVGVFAAPGVRTDPELLVRAIRMADLEGIVASGLVEVVHERDRLASGPIGLVPAPDAGGFAPFRAGAAPPNRGTVRPAAGGRTA